MTKQFKAGDRVRRINHNNEGAGWTLPVGATGTVTKVNDFDIAVDVDDKSLGVPADECMHSPCHFELIEEEQPKKKPHVHREIMIACANGESIQVYDEYEKKWVDTPYPSFHHSCKYRIKPQPKPDLVEVRSIELIEEGFMYFHNRQRTGIPMVEFTFDGETQKLKSVKILEEK